MWIEYCWTNAKSTLTNGLKITQMRKLTRGVVVQFCRNYPKTKYPGRGGGEVMRRSHLVRGQGQLCTRKMRLREAKKSKISCL